jgi:hypothetical protein
VVGRLQFKADPGKKHKTLSRRRDRKKEGGIKKGRKEGKEGNHLGQHHH